ncbi:MAG: sensor histidine kinase, partial [Chloroflexota bacterium]
DVVGRLYLTNKQGATQFSAEDGALVETFALHAGIAIENARLHEQVQRLAVVDERDRISRDLHDSVIQMLYAVTLSLDDVPELVQATPAEASRRVDDAIDALHAVIRDIRHFIFGLRPLLLDSGSLFEGLEALADELRRNTRAEIELTGEDPPGLPLAVVAELLAIAREALANVARHSNATRVIVGLDSTEGEVRLQITDDGIGLRPEAQVGRGHNGLANMRTRTEALDGSFEIESSPDAGTRIIVTVARTERRGTGQ